MRVTRVLALLKQLKSFFSSFLRKEDKHSEQPSRQITTPAPFLKTKPRRTSPLEATTGGEAVSSGGRRRRRRQLRRPGLGPHCSPCRAGALNAFRNFLKIYRGCETFVRTLSNYLILSETRGIELTRSASVVKRNNESVETVNVFGGFCEDFALILGILL